MNLETVINQEIHALTESEQAQVLDFIQNLKEKNQNVSNEQTSTDEKPKKRYSFIGIMRSNVGDISARAEEILMAEIDKRSGWTVKDERLD